MTIESALADETRPTLAAALNVLASARIHAALHSVAFGLCVVGSDGDVILLACERGGQPEQAIAAATDALRGTSRHADESAGSVLPDLGLLGGTVSGGIGIVANEPFARLILDGALNDLRGYVERFLRQ